MSLIDQLDADLGTIFADWAEPFTVKLAGATVATVNGIFAENVETASPYEAGVVVYRPAVSFPVSTVAAFDKSHTYTRTKSGITYKTFGDPQTDLGLTQIFLVKA
jgi:hypothetical protein